MPAQTTPMASTEATQGVRILNLQIHLPPQLPARRLLIIPSPNVGGRENSTTSPTGTISRLARLKTLKLELKLKS